MLSYRDGRSSSHGRCKPTTPKDRTRESSFGHSAAAIFKLEFPPFGNLFPRRARATLRRKDGNSPNKSQQSSPPTESNQPRVVNSIKKSLTFSATTKPTVWSTSISDTSTTAGDSSSTSAASSLASSSSSEKIYFSQSLKKESEEIDESDFICAICLEILYRPRQLTCGHSFCLTCLQSYSNTCSNKLSCPSCRQMVHQPPNGVSDLPRNLHLEKIADRLRTRRRSLARKGNICLKCYSETEVKECVHCSKGWCAVCYPAHLKEVKEDVLRLRGYLEESKERLIFKQEEEETRFDKLEERIKEALEIRKEELTTKIQRLRETSQGRVQRMSREVENTLDSLRVEQSKETAWDETWRRCNKINQLLTSLSSSMDQRVTFDTSTITLNGPKNTPERVLRKESSVGSEDQEEEDDYGFILPIDRSAFYRRKSSCSKYRWGKNICSRPAGIAISPWTEHIYVTASDSCKVHIFDQNGKQLHSFGSRGHRDGCFMCPIGIAFSVVNKELYITDKWKHCIHVFDRDGRFLRQIGKKGKGFAEFSSPEGVATDTNGKIYVADTCNDRVQILDRDGVFEGEVGLISSELLGRGRFYTKREFNEPVGVAVSSDGSKIYVADSGNHRIKVFDRETGARELVFGSRGRNKSQFESPESVAVDDKGFILVSDSGNGRIQVFRPNGRFVRSFGSKSNKRGEFGWVSGVAVTKNSEIIVTDFKNNTIAAF